MVVIPTESKKKTRLRDGFMSAPVALFRGQAVYLIIRKIKKARLLKK